MKRNSQASCTSGISALKLKTTRQTQAPRRVSSDIIFSLPWTILDLRGEALHTKGRAQANEFSVCGGIKLLGSVIIVTVVSNCHAVQFDRKLSLETSKPNPPTDDYEEHFVYTEHGLDHNVQFHTTETIPP